MMIMLLWAVCFTRLVFAAVGMLAPQLLRPQAAGQANALTPAIMISVVAVFAGAFIGSKVYNAWPDAYRDPDNRASILTTILAALVALPLHFLVWRVTRIQPPLTFALCLLLTLAPCFQSKTKATS